MAKERLKNTPGAVMAVIACVKGDGCCRSGIACVYYGGGCTCSLFIHKQTLVQYKEEKKKEKKNATALRCICISSPVPHRHCGWVI